MNRIEIRVKKHEFEGSPFSGYVKVGRELKTPWQVRLYYGLARVFVRNGANAVINAKIK